MAEDMAKTELVSESYVLSEMDVAGHRTSQDTGWVGAEGAVAGRKSSVYHCIE